MEESFLKQKSRIKWLQDGDHNTSFCHKYVQSMQTREKNSSLVCLDGTIVREVRDIVHEITSFYISLLGSSDPNCTGGDPAYIQSLLTSFLDPVFSDMLAHEVFEDDILKDFQSMPKNKTPSPDGFTVEFFLAAWEIVGPSVILVVKEFFSSGNLLTQLNSTAIALIPKVPHPTMITEFRPISC